MKKLFNSRFLFILASSLVVLILLVVGAFYLFDDEDDKFVKSGYVLNPLSSTSEKYFFDENVGYKENLSSMIEFVDVDEKTVSILKDSFVHYLDESMSFLKKGAILDLDSVRGDSPVAFYNITDESIIEKDDIGYVISSTNGDIKLNNFIGRISDNKYIVVGDLSLKMVGNSTDVKGDYFEIVYVEEGIVNIENKDVKYQVAADGTYINVGNDKVIDLGDKKITVNGVDAMSITAITIDGDENIEIIPKGNEDDDNDSSDDDNNDVGQDNQGSQTGTNEGTGDGAGNEQTGENGDDGTGNEDGTTDDESEELKIELIDYITDSTYISVMFDVENASETDLLKLKVTDLNNMTTKDISYVTANDWITASSLSSNTKYLFRVINERNNETLGTWIFETSVFGIKVEKEYATFNSLAYNVVIDVNKNGDLKIDDVTFTLKKFNDDEDVMDFEDVKVMKLNELKEVSKGVYSAEFDGLEPDTIYALVVNGFCNGGICTDSGEDGEKIVLNNMTLKRNPTFNEEEMDAYESDDKSGFILDLGSVDDPDNAIRSYTYLIYDIYNSTEVPVMKKVQTNNSPFLVEVGEGEGKLSVETNYYYKVVVEYFDNEKLFEYVTSNESITFVMGEEPYVTVDADEERISYDTIGATITILDKSCLLPLDGRKCPGNNDITVKIIEKDGLGIVDSWYVDDVEFVAEGDELLVGDLYLKDLNPGMSYEIVVLATYGDNTEQVEIAHTTGDDRIINTKSLSSFNVKWTNKGWNEIDRHVVNAEVQLANGKTGSMTHEETAEQIKKVVIKLYQGETNQFKQSEFLGAHEYSSEEYNLKEMFYDNPYLVTSTDTFGLDYDTLVQKNDGEYVNKNYTLLIEAYYENDKEVDFDSGKSYVYDVSAFLFGEVDLQLKINKITDAQSNLAFNSNLQNGGTIAGYGLNIAFDWESFDNKDLTPKRIYFYVYDSNTKEKLDFYTMNDDGELQLTQNQRYIYTLTEDDKYLSIDDDEPVISIYMAPGTSYDVVDDEVMTRGNYFTIGYEIESENDDGDTSLNPTPSSVLDDSSYAKSPSGYGAYKNEYAEKEQPTLKMFVATSDENSITYEYEMADPDNAIYKEIDSDTYGFYTTVDYGSETKIDMELAEGATYNYFKGRFTIDGLSNDIAYSYYYKLNMLKTGKIESDVMNVLDGKIAANRIFDGAYKLADNADEYNFKYQIINDSNSDNRVVIKLLMDNSLFDRILSYRVKFTDERGNEKTFELDDDVLKDLTVCPGDADTATPRCLSIDYVNIKEMMSDLSGGTNTITVTVTAIYDNGLTGYDYLPLVGDKADDEYLYMIMQDNSSSTGKGAYISHTPGGSSLTLWNSELLNSDQTLAAKGYYTSSWQGTDMGYLNKRFPKYSQKRINSPSLGAGGYYASGLGYLNPKMVSVEEMQCSGEEGCNTFSFFSIKPKIKVTEKANLINGVAFDMVLNSFDVDSVKNEDGKYYLYIETWDYSNSSKAGLYDSIDENGDLNFVASTARPRVRVEVDGDNAITNGKTYTAIVDQLLEQNSHPGTYSFAVYAYMLTGLDNAGNPVYQYTQLPSAKYGNKFETEIYKYKTALAKDLFNSVDVVHNPASDLYDTEQVYGNRILSTTIELVAYSYDKKAVPFNYDLHYVMCEVGNCNKGLEADSNNSIFYKEIPVDELIRLTSTSNSVVDNEDISSYVKDGKIEFGKQYHIYVYVEYDYYNADTKEVERRTFCINQYYPEVSLAKLVEPTFTVTRSAVLEQDSNGNDVYAIDFGIKSTDDDHDINKTTGYQVLVDGKYYIELQEIVYNEDGTPRGTVISEGDEGYENLRMQLLDDNGNYYDEDNYKDYAFSASVLNQKLRITGLKPDTEYYLRVYGDVFLNNADIPVDERVYEVTDGDYAYTTNNYGLAFGKAQYTINPNSWTVLFSGASNLRNNAKIKSVTSTIMDLTTNESNTYNYNLETSNKKFETVANSNDLKFTIDDSSGKMKNVVGHRYSIVIAITLDDIDPVTGAPVVIDYTKNSSFSYSTTYVIEDK